MSSSDATADRTIPEALLALAERAIRHGAEQVSIGLESTGGDIPAPIGWTMGIHRTLTGDWALVSHQPGSDFDGAHYMKDGVDPLAWLYEAENAGSPSPVVEELVDAFKEAARQGWSVKYTRDLLMYEAFAKFMVANGEDPVGTLRHQLQATAHNWAWSRDAAEPLSHEYFLSAQENGESPVSMGPVDVTVPYSNGALSWDDVLSALRQKVPYFAQVALYDDDLEDWVL